MFHLRACICTVVVLLFIRFTIVQSKYRHRNASTDLQIQLRMKQKCCCILRAMESICAHNHQATTVKPVKKSTRQNHMQEYVSGIDFYQMLYVNT